MNFNQNINLFIKHNKKYFLNLKIMKKQIKRILMSFLDGVLYMFLVHIY